MMILSSDQETLLASDDGQCPVSRARDTCHKSLSREPESRHVALNSFII